MVMKKIVPVLCLLLAGCSPQAVKEKVAARRPPRAELPTRLEWLSRPSPPKAGLPALWSFKVIDLTTDKLTPKGIRAYESPHAVALHLFVVTRDFGDYAHYYPSPRDYGNFLMRAVLPRAGAYQLFADYVPIGYRTGAPAFPTWKSQRFLATGEGAIPPARPLVPSTAVAGWMHAKVAPRKEETFGDAKAAPVYDVSLKSENPLRAGDGAKFVSRVRDLAGGAVTPQKHLNGAAYGMAISADGNDFVRLEAVRDASGNTKWQGKFNKAGLHGIWLEFLINDKVVVAPFTVKVEGKS